MNSEESLRRTLRRSMELNGDVPEREVPAMSVDLQEFGEMRANVQTLIANDEKQTVALERLATAVQAIQLQLAEAKGGWKLFLMVGSACASLGGFVSWIAHEVFKR